MSTSKIEDSCMHLKIETEEIFLKIYEKNKNENTNIMVNLISEKINIFSINF